MRLTSKNTSEEYAKNPKTGDVIKAKYDWVDLDNSPTIYYPLTKVLNKLGQLEDVEDELGIELLTLFKALKGGIYIKKQTQYTYPLALLRTHYSNHTTRYYVYDSGKEKEIKLKDYGKTWALTKEELEK